MNLNEYIYNKIKELDYLVDNEIPSEEDIEKWIVEWYSTTFKAVGCDGTKEEDRRLPPMWLANWRKVWEREQKK